MGFMLVMSYPYHGQYPENYSTPTTPHAYTQWEIDPQHQPELQHLQQQQPPQQQAQPQQTYQANQTIQLEEPERIVPSQHREAQQAHDNTPVRLHPVHTGSTSGHHNTSHEGRSEDAIPAPVDINPRILHVDTTHLTSTSPAESITTNTMLLRRSPRAHPRLMHPYRRPQSATGPPNTRHRRELEQHVRFAGQEQVAAPSPASGSSRIPSFGSTISSPVPATSGETSFPTESGSGSGSEHRFIIRTDVHYDPESKVVIAMLELPGVKKADLSVTLSTSFYNRVKQVTVSGRSRPAFPLDNRHMHTVRERKFGVFTRTFAVPSDTKLEDIDAQMEDGVLTLKISCGGPGEPEDPQEVPVR